MGGVNLVARVFHLTATGSSKERGSLLDRPGWGYDETPWEQGWGGVTGLEVYSPGLKVQRMF